MNLNLGILAAVLVAISVGASATGAAEIKRAADAPQPLSPAESAKRFALPPGFRIDLVASEPMLADPVAMAFDARGRMFVCELHGYNVDGHYDITELNKTGVLDKTVRRIPASKEALAHGEAETYGTVKLLEDTDGDGRVDRMSVWADRLPACYGVIAARDGVIVLCAPDIIYLADRDGDGKAEVRETLFSGFGVGELWTRISNPRWGIDNWIYAACGHGSGGTIRGPHLTNAVTLGNTSFRFKADGSQFEPVSGGTSGFGLTLNDWDDRFLVSNQEHALFVAPLPYRYLARNPYAAAPRTVVNISTYGHPARVFPTAPPDPWRIARSVQPEWVKFYGAAETTMGLVTAACAPLIYRADQFPSEYRDNHFSCDPAYNLIHRCIIEPDGASFKARRATDNVEFLTSTEQWFRPVNLVLAPEGALYVVDMYREIIEDYTAIPRYLQQQYGLIEGHDKGRIWRVSHGDSRATRARDFSKMSATQLVSELSSSNAFHRETAQRMLVERRDIAAADALAQLVRSGAIPQARLHALYVLDGLGALAPEVAEAALRDSHPGVRLHALRLAETWIERRSGLREHVLEMVEDPDAKVRLQVAFSLGETRDARRWPALAALAAHFGNDAWMQAAIISSVPDSAGRLVKEILQRPDTGEGRKPVKPLAAVIGARQDAAEVAEFLEAVGSCSGVGKNAVQADGLSGLLAALQRSSPAGTMAGEGRAALRQLLASGAGPVRTLALKVAGLYHIADAPELEAAFAAAAREALDSGRPIAERQAAIALLGSAPPAVLAPAVDKLVEPQQPLDIQLAAVAAVTGQGGSSIAPMLLRRWSTYSPRLQNAVIEAVFRSQSRIAALLDAVEKGSFPAAGLDSLRKDQLLTLPDQTLRNRAQALLAGHAADPERQARISRYQQALGGARDTQHGRQLFDEQCRRCHSVLNDGGKIGPDLGGTKGRAEETLLMDILQPSDQITAGYRSYTISMRDGEMFTGIVSSESATSVTLPGEDGREQVLLRKDIENMQMSEISLMPENLADVLRPSDVADVLAFLREALAAGPPAVLSLFDDEKGFADLLNEGQGTATVVEEEKLSGAACLKITPLQRSASRIAGWNYPIAERPGPGEYRFLRFSWKAPAAKGVMLEFASRGQWPPPDKPLWRYCSGQNSSGWRARRLANDPPAEWTTVTVDLWRDFGPFTLTGLAPTAMGGPAYFDCIQLLRALDPGAAPAATSE